MHLAIHPVDFTIVAAYLVGVVVLGVWIGRGRHDPAGYLLAGRDLSWWAILGSVVATETSTATFLSVPGIAFAAGGDLRFLQLAIGFMAGRIVVSQLLLPRFFQGNLFTAYEVLQQRFGGATKMAASMVFLVARNLGDGLRLFLAAIVLEKVVGLDLYVCVLMIGLATIIYTFVGGMKAVVWNDCQQLLIYLLGAVVAGVIIVVSIPGGLQQVFSVASAENKFRVFDFALDYTDPYTFWAGLVGGALLSMGTHGTDQMMVQRYLCARSQKDAQRALVLSGVVVFFQFGLFLLLGIALSCFYSQVSPQTAFDRNDEVLATFIVEQMPVGLVGVTLAAVFAAAMSTLSSSLNSSATATVYDLYRPLCRPKPNAKHLVRVSRWLTVVFGLLQIVIGVIASYVSRSVVEDVLAIAGFTAGILLGVFALGVLSRRANQAGVLGGLLAGVVVLTVVKFATPVAWPWYAPLGAVTTFLVGYLASCVFRVVSHPKGGQK